MSLPTYVTDHHAKAVKLPLGEWVLKNPLPALVETKFDGTRVFLFKNGETIVLATKHNGVWNANTHPELFESLKPEYFEGERLILDCEAIPLKKPRELKAFDILQADNVDLTPMSLSTRKVILARVVKQKPMAVKGTWCYNVEQISRLKEQTIEQGYEGVMVKNPYSAYGQTNSWLKLKKHDTADVFTIGFDLENETYRTTGIPHSWFIGVFDEKGEVVEIGKVGSYEEGVNPADVKVGTVIEVEYQEVTEARKLRNPFIKRVRFDKLPKECLISQLNGER